MSVNSINPTQKSFFDTVRGAASNGANWVKINATSAASSVSNVAKSVGASVYAFFAFAAQKIGAWLTAGKEAVVTLSGKVSTQVKSLSPEMKMGAACLAIGTVIGALLYKCARTAAPEQGEQVNEGNTQAAPAAGGGSTAAPAAAAPAAAAAAPAAAAPAAAAPDAAATAAAPAAAAPDAAAAATTNAA